MAESGVYISVNMDVSRAEKNWAKYVKGIEQGEDKLAELEAQIDALINSGAKWGDKEVVSLMKQERSVRTLLSSYEALAKEYRQWLDLNASEQMWGKRGSGHMVTGKNGTRDVVPTETGREQFDAEQLFQYKSLAEQIKIIVSEIDDSWRRMHEGVESTIRDALPRMKTALGDMFSGMVQGAVNLGGGMARVLGGAFQSIGNKFKATVRKPFDDFRQLILRNENLFQNAFMFNVIAKGMREVSSYLQSALTKNTELNQQLGQIKGALYAMIQPLVNIIAPVLAKILSFVTSIVVAVGQFIASLTGKSWSASVAGAKAVSGSMASGAKSAKEMQKSLAGFDEITNLNSNSDSSGGGGGGSGGVSPTFDFSNVKKIDLKEFIDNLKKKMDDAFKKILSIDWRKLGKTLYQSLVKVISGVDWNGLVDSTFTLLGGLVGAIVAFLEGFFEDIYNKVKGYFKKRVKQMGGNIVLGILAGIMDAMLGILNWIKKHIFDPFINGFKQVFGISSPSKVMEEMGGYLIDGFKKGLSGIWNSVSSIFTNLVNNIKSAFNNGWTAVKNGVTSAMNNVKTAVSNAWNTLKSGAKTAFDAVVNTFSGLASRLRTAFSDAWSAVKNVFSANGLSSLASSIGSTFRSLLNSLIAGLNNAIYYPFEAIQYAFNNLRWKSIFGHYIFSGLPVFTIPHIPYLAQGSVVPPNREFLAMLGDNPNETEVVSPLSTMKEALIEALAESGFGGQTIRVNVDGKALFEIVRTQSKEYTARTGSLAMI